MGKVSPPFIKYVIKAKFTTVGVVEKPDVIGAIFGQTEGLLGEDLELRELQKKGKIGRIDAEMANSENQTTGVVTIPTSIDKAETTLIAAAVETIDRIGPCDAKFEIDEIADTRGGKRDFILERAKQLMEKLSSATPEIKEMEQSVIDHNRTSKVREIGDEKIAVGPDVEVSNEIIIVEGRADVVNLLKCGIKNAIAMNGTKVPKIVYEMAKEKIATLFVDGDRGGILIAKNVLETLNIKYVVKAPDGKEVEELVEKEAVACLRNKMTVEEFKQKFLVVDENKRYEKSYDNRERGYNNYSEENRSRENSSRVSSNLRNREDSRKFSELSENKEPKEPKELVKITAADQKEIEKLFKSVENTKLTLLISKEDKKLIAIDKVQTTKLSNAIYQINRRGKNVDVLAIDGTVTPRIIAMAEQAGIAAIAAKNFSASSEKIKLISV